MTDSQLPVTRGLTTPKSVCVVTLHPADDVRVRYREIATLADAGYKVRLIARPPTVKMPSTDSRIAISIVSRPLRPLRSRVPLILALTRELWRDRSEVVHLHDPDLLPSGALAASLGRRRVIYDVHEFYGLKWSASFPERLAPVVRWLVDRIEALLANRCTGVVVVNELMKHRLSGRRPQRVAVVPNYASSATFVILLRSTTIGLLGNTTLSILGR